MSLLKKLASETALYGLSSIVGRLLLFVFITPYLTRKFPSDQMGIYTDIYAWAAFLMVLFTYRIETTFFKFGAQKEHRFRAYRTAISTIFFTTLVFVSLLLAFSQPIANWLEYPQHKEYIFCFAFIVGFDALSAVPFALLRLQGKAMRFATIRLINLFVTIGGILFFLELGPKMAEWQVLGAQNWYSQQMGIGFVFLSNLLASALTFILLIPSLFSEKPTPDVAEKRSGDFGFDKKLLTEMLIYALPLVVAGLAGIINEVLDRTLLKNLLPGTLEQRLSAMGIYGACYKISIFMSLFTQAFNYAAEPFFFKNADRNDSKTLYADIAFLFALVGCVAFLAISTSMDLVQYFVAESYREGLKIVPILLLANLCLGLYYNVAIWYKLKTEVVDGKKKNFTKMGALVALIGASVTIIANLILIPLLGYLGSAWATLACYATMLIACYILGQKYYPIPYPVRKITSYILLVLACYGLHWGIYSLLQPKLFLSLFLAFVFVLVYLGIIWMAESKNLKRILKR